jgi:hypothetical protein
MVQGFGSLAMLFAFTSISTVPQFLNKLRSGGVIPTISGPGWVILPYLYAFLGQFVLVMPAFLTALYALAWYTSKKQRGSARAWAISASVGVLLQSAPIALAAMYALSKQNDELAWKFIIIDLLIVTPGLLGLFLYLPAGERIAMNARMRLVGDGTEPSVDRVAWVVAAAGYLGGQYLCLRWGRLAHLTESGPAIYWLSLIFALMIEAGTHEAGHGLVGSLFGMRVQTFQIGPFEWSIRNGEWRFRFILANVFVPGGATSVGTTRLNQSMWCEVCMLAAGPLFSLLTGIGGLWVMLSVRGTSYERVWEIASMVGTFGLVSFVVNLLPLRPDVMYSDGAFIYQILGGGRWAAFHRVHNMVSSSQVTSIRPRDFNIEMIKQASVLIREGRQGLLLRFFAYNHYLDKGCWKDALESLDAAREIYVRMTEELSAELHIPFVFGYALLTGDRDETRLWWHRMQERGIARKDAVHWLAESALLFAEKDEEQALKAWETGHRIASKLPNTGACDFNRYCFKLLQQGTMMHQD